MSVYIALADQPGRYLRPIEVPRLVINAMTSIDVARREHREGAKWWQSNLLVNACVRELVAEPAGWLGALQER